MGLLRLGQKTPEIAPGRTVADAVRIMTEDQVGAIAVTEGRKIVGIFTERDLMRRIVYEGKDPSSVLVKDVMTKPVWTVRDSTTVAQAATLMWTHRFRHLAIVDEDNNLLGMVALRYLLYDLLQDLERKVDNLEGYIMADSLGG